MATNGQTTAKTAKQSYEELAAMLAAAQAKLAQTSALRFKVSEKGALSCYGLGRFPLTLYASQWERLEATGCRNITLINKGYSAMRCNKPQQHEKRCKTVLLS